MPTPVILQAFDELNPPTVAQLNRYFRTVAAAINALAGETIVEWSAAGPSGDEFLPITGGTLSGPLTLSGNAVSPLHAVPLQQISGVTGFMPVAGGTFTGPVTLSGDAATALQPVTKQQLEASAFGTDMPITLNADQLNDYLILKYGSPPTGQIWMAPKFSAGAWNIDMPANAQGILFDGGGANTGTFFLGVNGGFIHGGFIRILSSDNTVRVSGYAGNTLIDYAQNLDLQAAGDIRCFRRLMPASDNAVTLGLSSNRWASVWAVNGTIQTSDEDEKTDIVDSDLGLDFLLALRPIAYRWKTGGNETAYDAQDPLTPVTTSRPGRRRHYGLSAQAVKEALGGRDFGGYVEDADSGAKGLRYDQFIAPLIRAVQELDGKLNRLAGAAQP